MMCKNGGFVRIQTCGTVVNCTKNSEEQNIICVNYLITGREQQNFIVDQSQLEIIKREPVVVFPKSENSIKSSEIPKNINDDKSNVKIDVERAKVEDEPSTTGKRGRKRKMKSETKENSTTPTDSNVSENYSEVRQLENVMSKHLPKSEESTDFSTLERQAIHNDSKNNHPIHFGHDNLAPTPASALLRQLYASRESVIRATAKPGGGNFMFPDGSHHHSHSTPPNDFDYLRKTTGESFGNFVSSYGTYPSMDYHNAMTPPSSVSPRDLTNHKSTRNNCDYLHLASTSTSDERLHSQAMNHHDSASSLPLKPHPYPAHQIDASSYGLDHQSQYFPYHTGFHLYKSHHVYTPP